MQNLPFLMTERTLPNLNKVSPSSSSKEKNIGIQKLDMLYPKGFNMDLSKQ